MFLIKSHFNLGSFPVSSFPSVFLFSIKYFTNVKMSGFFLLHSRCLCKFHPPLFFIVFIFNSDYYQLFSAKHVKRFNVFFQITFGSEIPKTYYVRDSIKVDYDQSVTIGRSSSHQVEYELLAPNCALR